MQSVLFLLFFLVITWSAKTTLEETLFMPDVAYSEREGIYAKSDSPGGDGPSLISFDFVYRPQFPNNDTLTNPIVAEIVLIHSSILKKVGRTSIWNADYCCSEELMLADMCDTPDRLIIDDIDSDPNRNDNLFYYWSQEVSDSVHFNRSVEPLVSGVWYLIFVNCDLTRQRSLIFSGNTEWRSPFGYLPAQAFGSMIIYYILAFLYFVSLIAWGVLMFLNQKDLHKYQHGISILLLISLIEELIKSGTDISYNIKGLIDLASIGAGIFFTALKLTIIRFLLLLIAHGYAITKPTISQKRLGVIVALSTAYFVCTAADEYLALSSLERPVTPGVQFLASALLIIFNAIIISWIVCTAIASMKIAKKESNEKYPMYRNLLRIFGAICVIAILAFFAVIGVTFAGVIDDAYQWYWLLDTYWDMIYYAITVYMCWVWRPTENNQRYAYVAVETNDNKNVELEEHKSDDQKDANQAKSENQELESSSEDNDNIEL